MEIKSIINLIILDASGSMDSIYNQALHYSHADYKVALQPLAVITPDIQCEMTTGSVMALQLSNAVFPKMKTTIRLDTYEPLGIVSENYGIVQNEDAFKFIDTLVTGKHADQTHTCN